MAAARAVVGCGLRRAWGAAARAGRLAGVARPAPTASRGFLSCAGGGAIRGFQGWRGGRGTTVVGAAPSWSAGACAGARRTLFIQMQTTPNPDSVKFVPEGKEVLPAEFGTGRDYRSVADAKGAPIARALLGIQGVVGVFLGPDFVSVAKDEESDWTVLRPLVFGAIMDAYASGKPLVTSVAGAHDTAADEEDDEVVEMIKELLETRIRPAVQEDGGDIFFAGFDADLGIVRVKLAGACVGCGSSEITLRNGVENMLMHYIPEVKGLEQVLDEEEEQVKRLSTQEFENLEARLAAAGVRE